MDSKQSGLNCEVVILQGVNLSRIVESMSVDLICKVRYFRGAIIGLTAQTLSGISIMNFHFQTLFKLFLNRSGNQIFRILRLKVLVFLVYI